MTPEEKKKNKAQRILRIAVPVLLACFFASLAVFEKTGVFAAANQAGSVPAAELPAPVPVPLTELAVLNRLENDGFTAAEDQLLRNGLDAGSLRYERTGGELTGVVYSLIVLPGDEALPGGTLGEEMRAQSEADAENARLVLHAMLEAVLGGSCPSEKQLAQADKKLSTCLSAAGAKDAAFSIDDCSVSVTKAYADGIYWLTVKVRRPDV